MRSELTGAAQVDHDLFEHLKAAAKKSEIEVMDIPSGAGHDSAVMADMGVPITMIFVANQDGSHNWKEKMKLDDFMLGTEVLFTAISTFDK